MKNSNNPAWLATLRRFSELLEVNAKGIINFE